MKSQVLWRRMDQTGHDACRLDHHDSNWILQGAAVYSDGADITCLRYNIICDANWITRTVKVSGWCGSTSLNIEIIKDTLDTWWLNGREVDQVSGCLDIDLGFTPATNTCAIKRLNLDVSQRKDTTAAWLDTSDWQLKPLAQYYHRRSETAFQYGSPAHGFTAQLIMDRSGLVTDYADLWTASSFTRQ